MATNAKNDSKKKLFKFSDFTWTLFFIVFGVFLIATIILLIWIWETPITVTRPFF